MSMTYKGYTGSVDYSAPDRVFHGRLIGITDVITFEGASVEELENDFVAAVDDYLDSCAEDGVEPQRPYSGRFVLRLPPELHGQVTAAGRRSRTSMNAWIVEAIRMRLEAEAPVARSGAVDDLSEAAGG
jgi:predicted HicB family RNase H-like nuclease